MGVGVRGYGGKQPKGLRGYGGKQLIFGSGGTLSPLPPKPASPPHFVSQPNSQSVGVPYPYGYPTP